MKRFWNSRARENAPFYIATWRGFRRSDTEEFFLSGEQVVSFIRESGYQPTGQDSMIEIGCGIGRMTHGFAELFGNVYAIDISGEMIARAQSLLGDINNVHFYETSGADLSPFQDDSIDFCFSFIVFQHIPSKDVIFKYVQEAGRVLKRGGVFHFQVKGLPDPDVGESSSMLTIKRFYRRFVRRPALTAWRRLRGLPRGMEAPAWTGTSLTSQEVKSVCAQSGLTVRRITGQGTQYMWVTAAKLALASPEERSLTMLHKPPESSPPLSPR
jgi:SAM-dependent methyltransferase